MNDLGWLLEEAGMKVVGRDAELAALGDALASAQRGSRQLVLVRGEPGIGKTTLVDHLRDAAQDVGACVLSGADWEGGAPPYWPWIQVIRGAQRAAPDVVARRANALGPLGAIPSQIDRFVFYDAVAELLKDLAVQAPVVAVLEDLHAAGPATADLLEYVQRSTAGSAVVLVGTYRPAEVAADGALAPVISRLEGMGTVLSPRPFDRAEIEAVLRSVGLQAERSLVDAVRERTQGNPLFVAHVARELAAGGAAASTGLPLGLRNALRRQAEAAESGSAGGVLETAALMDDDVDVALLSAVAEVPHGEVARILKRAAQVGLLKPSPRDNERYAFSHALVREALYDGIPAARAAALHLRTAHLLENVAGPGRLARHFGLAWPAGGAVEALRYARQAADQAMRAGAHAEAAEAYQQAAMAHTRLTSPDPLERAELLLAMAEARLRSGSVEDAHQAAADAMALGRSLDDPAIFARAALLASAALPFNDPHLDAIAILREADERFGEATSAERAGILARLAEVLAVTDREAAMALAARAEQMAPDSPAALAARLDVEWGRHEPADALARAERLSEAVSNPSDAARAAVWAFAFSLEAGDVASARAAVTTLSELAERSREPAIAHLALSRRVTLITAEGDHARGLAAAVEAREVARRFALADGDAVAWGQFFCVWRAGGLPSDLRSDMERIARELGAASPYPLAHEGALVLLLVNEGREQEARALLRRLVAQVDTLEPDLLYVWSLALLAEGVAALDDVDAAKAIYPKLLPYADRFVVAAGGVACLGSVQHHLGGLAAVLDQRERAIDHVASAVRAHRDAGCVAFEADARRRLEALQSERLTLDARDGIVTLRYRSEVAQLPASLGLDHLAVLAASPGRDISAVRLASLAAGERRGSADLEHLGEQAMPDEVLDQQALASYRSRLAEIDAELAEAGEAFDDVRRESLENERDALLAELRGALGLGGRPRRFTDETERARVNVTRAIRSAIKKVAERAPALGAHLEQAVTTGRHCRYEPQA